MVAQSEAKGKAKRSTKKSKTPAELERISAQMCWATAEIVVEVKSADPSGHPFGEGPGLRDLLPTSSARRESRGQIVEYASEIFRRQHRLFVFVISICGNYARFLRFDRSGAIVSERFDYCAHPECMGDFLFRLFGPDATPVTRGHDPTVTAATSEEAAMFGKLHETEQFSPLERTSLRLAAVPGWPIHRMTITSPWSPTEGTGTDTIPYARAVRDTDPPESRNFLVGHPMFSSRSMVSRGTKVFVAYDLKEKIPVVIKDAWRHDRGQNAPTELSMYQELWKDIPDSGLIDGVRPFLTPVGGGDVADMPCESDVGPPGCQWQRTRPGPPSGTTPQRLPRVHTRLVIKEVCAPLSEFKHAFELVLVIWHTLFGSSFPPLSGIY